MGSPTSWWFKLVLCDISDGMVDAWKVHWKPSTTVPVEFYAMPFNEVPTPFDCMVSPANSFGLMDGGIDWHISQYFGGRNTFIPRVQQVILDEFCGQQPVGTSFIIPTGRPDGCRWLAHTPTMRLPQRVGGTDMAYRAMWAMLLAVRRHNRSVPDSDRIRTVLCPGLCTGCGSMPYMEAAQQMALAYRHFVTNPADTDTDCVTASDPVTKAYRISWEYSRSVQEAVLGSVMLREEPGAGAGGNWALVWSSVVLVVVVVGVVMQWLLGTLGRW